MRQFFIKHFHLGNYENSYTVRRDIILTLRQFLCFEMQMIISQCLGGLLEELLMHSSEQWKITEMSHNLFLDGNVVLVAAFLILCDTEYQLVEFLTKCA